MDVLYVLCFLAFFFFFLSLDIDCPTAAFTSPSNRIYPIDAFLVFFNYPCVPA